MDHARPRRAPGDPYQVLGVDTGASQQDITRAYRRAVQHAHPDARPHDPAVAARFQALTAAYELLRDPAGGRPTTAPTRRENPAGSRSRTGLGRRARRHDGAAR